MDAKTNIESRLFSRHVAEESERQPHRPGCATHAAAHLPAAMGERGRKCDLSDIVEIFKKTPYAAGLKPAGRYVAKDMRDIGVIPLLMKTLLDRGTLDSDFVTVTGRMIAENLKAVKRNSHQDAVRSADKPTTATGGGVGRKGNLAPEIAAVPLAFPEDEDAVKLVAGARLLDRKLTGEKLGARQSKSEFRATNHMSGALWRDAQQVGRAVECVGLHSAWAHEKRCYADI
jgi:dihydroxy-acid dehydratase